MLNRGDDILVLLAAGSARRMQSVVDDKITATLAGTLAVGNAPLYAQTDAGWTRKYIGASGAATTHAHSASTARN